MIELLKRPQIEYTDLAEFDPGRPALKYSLVNKLEIELKYSGYIKIQQEQIEKCAVWRKRNSRQMWITSR